MTRILDSNNDGQILILLLHMLYRASNEKMEQDRMVRGWNTCGALAE
jgi:hypothetical protein